MTLDEIEARKQKLIEKYKKLYAKYNDDPKADNQQIRRKMYLIASEIGWLIEEKRRLRNDG